MKSIVRRNYIIYRMLQRHRLIIIDIYLQFKLFYPPGVMVGASGNPGVDVTRNSPPDIGKVAVDGIGVCVGGRGVRVGGGVPL